MKVQVLGTKDLSKVTLIDQWIWELDKKPRFNRWRSEKTYRCCLNRFNDYLQDNGIDIPDDTTMESFKQWLMRSMKPASINLYIIAVRSYFKFLREKKGIENSCYEVQCVSGVTTKHKKDEIPFDKLLEMHQLIDRSTLAGKRDYAILMLKTYRGIRDIEVSRLDVQDFRKNNGIYTINVLAKGATEKEERPCNLDKIINAILDYKNHLKKVYDYKSTDPLFISLASNYLGYRISTRYISNLMKNLIEMVIQDPDEREKMSSHSIRHTFANYLIDQGVPIRTVQILLGHKNVTTTEIYLDKINHKKAWDQADKVLTEVLNNVQENKASERAPYAPTYCFA